MTLRRLLPAVAAFQLLLGGSFRCSPTVTAGMGSLLALRVQWGYTQVNLFSRPCARLPLLSARRTRLSARIVECRFYGGLSHEEIAEALGVTVRTVERDWAKARMFLHEFLTA